MTREAFRLDFVVVFVVEPSALWTERNRVFLSERRGHNPSLVSSEEGRTKCNQLSFFKCHYQRSRIVLCVCVCGCVVCGEVFSEMMCKL